MQEICFPCWLFEGRPTQGKMLLPNGQNWQSYLAGSSKNHCEISISITIFILFHLENFFCYSYKLRVSYSKEQICKQIQIPSLQTGWLSMPHNKLPDNHIYHIETFSPHCALRSCALSYYYSQFYLEFVKE